MNCVASKFSRCSMIFKSSYRLFTVLFFALFLFSCAAVNTGKETERIIRTLSSDDMQGRAIFTPGIEKAAAFIENEFRDIGLQPMQGEKNFRINFSRPGDNRLLYNIAGMIPGRSKP